MSQLIIQGGQALKGTVKLGGAKNSSSKLMIAALLSGGETRLMNFAHIAEVAIVKKIILSLGGQVKSAGERTMIISAPKQLSSLVAADFGAASRAAAMFLAPLLVLTKRAKIPLPGGDQIGQRPLDRHFDGLRSLGAKVSLGSSFVEARAEQLTGCRYRFAKNSHTGTETMIMAAVLAQGKTVLDNAAEEPEVDDLINLLNQMGAKIKRSAGRRIEIEGAAKLNPVSYKVMPDRNEAVSYAIAALVTKGEVVVENARPEHLQAFLAKLNEVGGGYEAGAGGIRFFYRGPLAVTAVVTAPHPGFMTDWMPLWSILATQCRGVSTITEAVFTSRFQFVPDLVAMGAKIEWSDFRPTEPEEFYNFNLRDDPSGNRHAITVTGPTALTGGQFRVWDIRAGATLALAGLAAKGKTVLDQAELIDRGYEDFAGRLSSLGADIKKV